MKKLITISGPTASGKTDLSIKLASYLECSIISCDSRQFYKEMSIGTAVPTKSELSKIKHYCIQHKSIFDTYTVGDFRHETLLLLKKLFQNKDYVIITGGSGLYMDSIVKGIDFFPEINKNVREELNYNFNLKGIKYLQEQLSRLDPIYFSTVDINNQRRLIRALEVCISSGKPYSSFLNKRKNDYDFNIESFAIRTNRDVLYKRINARVDKMIEAGLIDEVKKLFKHKNLNPLNTVGYKEIFEFIEKKVSLEDSIEKIKQNTRRYAKRQITWLKNKDYKWIDSDIDLEEFIKMINSNN
ncbi:MAG: tRNA (adenosine(37)-N6)-dimethylallyltransferase MiaA [Flavobacteriaceae bacterium]